MISSDRYKERLQKAGSLSVLIGWQGSFCISPLWYRWWGSHLPFMGPENEASRALCSGLNQHPAGHVQTTDVVMGNHGWSQRCLSFHPCRPDFWWDTLFLSWLKRALHVFSPVFHNPRNASAAWVNYLQIVSRLFPLCWIQRIGNNLLIVASAPLGDGVLWVLEQPQTTWELCHLWHKVGHWALRQNSWAILAAVLSTAPFWVL